MLMTSLWKRGPRALAPLFLSFALSQGGCGGAAGSDSADDLDADLGAGGESPVSGTLEFSPNGTLTLNPGEVAQLSVLVSPARRQSVTFEILSEPSDTVQGKEFDGFLLMSSARTDSEGQAIVELKAPTQPSTFEVRASLSDGTEARRAVSVSSQGYGTLIVTPDYEGSREIKTWTASARAGATCEGLLGFFEDGPLLAQGANGATLSDVPSGPTIAVTLRGDELTSGCTTITSLDPDQEAQVTVSVTDRPVNVTAGSLDLSLGVDATTNSFAAHLEAAVAVGVDSLWGEAGDDAQALLLGMAETVDESERAAFEAAVAEFELGAAVAEVWGGTEPLSDEIYRLLSEAADEIPGPQTFQGRLDLGPGGATFYLLEAAGIPTALSGFFGGAVWKVTAESGDTIVMGGSLTYEPLRWLSAIAESRAERPRDVLKAAAACDEVAKAMVEAAAGPTHEDCGEACLTAVCEGTALRAWDGVGVAGNDLLTSLMIGVSGKALLTEKALIRSLDGSWVGRLESNETSVGGPMSAELSEAP